MRVVITFIKSEQTAAEGRGSAEGAVPVVGLGNAMLPQYGEPLDYGRNRARAALATGEGRRIETQPPLPPNHVLERQSP